MSIKSNFDELIHIAGIEAAVLYDPATHTVQLADGTPDLVDFLTTAFGLLRFTEGDIRIVFGKHTVYVMRRGGEAIGLAIPTGHPFCKSIHKVIRRVSGITPPAEQVKSRRRRTTTAARSKPEVEPSRVTDLPTEPTRPY